MRAVREGAWVLLDEINLAPAETLQRLAGLLDTDGSGNESCSASDSSSESSHSGKSGAAGGGAGGTLLLSERGDRVAVRRHGRFRLLAAMNPPTDAGKKELPPALRSRFTEIAVDEPSSLADLRSVAAARLAPVNAASMVTAGNGGAASAPPPAAAAAFGGARGAATAEACVNVYTAMRELERDETTALADGAGARPHYSLRTFARALSAARTLAARTENDVVVGGVYGAGLPPARALLEAFELSFVTQLSPGTGRDRARAAVRSALASRLGGGEGGALPAAGAPELEKPPRRPGGRAGGGADDWVLIAPFWLRSGPEPRVDWSAAPVATAADVGAQAGAAAVPAPRRFVLTPSVKTHLRALARAVASGRPNVLLQGPTSTGKTALVEYLAALTGHRCVRINNHEHTDVQEYLGAYAPASAPSSASSSDQGGGVLEFRDGALVRALRRGEWVLLDELNLAPSEVIQINRMHLFFGVIISPVGGCLGTSQL